MDELEGVFERELGYSPRILAEPAAAFRSSGCRRRAEVRRTGAAGTRMAPPGMVLLGGFGETTTETMLKRAGYLERRPRPK